MATSKHADILNALSEMQASIAYAVRRSDLAAAELLIVDLERTIERLNSTTLKPETRMNTKHTPGPWTIPDFGPPISIEANRQDEVWCVAEVGNGEMPSDEEEANARLISAAPDLFEACNRLLFWMDNSEVNIDLTEMCERSGYDVSPHMHEAFSAARAAIAKATGGGT